MPMQAIVTKYYGPTNTRGSYIMAKAWAGKIKVSYDSEKSVYENHAEAAEAFATRYEWSGEWAGGAMPDGQGYVFVNTDRGVAFSR